MKKQQRSTRQNPNKLMNTPIEQTSKTAESSGQLPEQADFWRIRFREEQQAGANFREEMAPILEKKREYEYLTAELGVKTFRLLDGHGNQIGSFDYYETNNNRDYLSIFPNYLSDVLARAIAGRGAKHFRVTVSPELAAHIFLQAEGKKENLEGAYLTRSATKIAHTEG